MSDLASASANSLSIQQLFSSLSGAGSAGSSNTDPDLFGQNLPSDPAESTTSGGSAKAGTSSTTASASAASLADQARSKRDAALAQSRLDLLGLQEQSSSGKGAHGAHHHHGGGTKPTSASSTADQPTDTPTAAASSAASVGGAGQTGITGSAANDEKTSGLSTLLMAQLAAA